MHLASLASPPLKNHLQHNLKKPSLEAPSSPSMCRVDVYLSRATPPDPLTTRSPDTTPLAPSTKAGFRNLSHRKDCTLCTHPGPTLRCPPGIWLTSVPPLCNSSSKAAELCPSGRTDTEVPAWERLVGVRLCAIPHRRHHCLLRPVGACLTTSGGGTWHTMQKYCFRRRAFARQVVGSSIFMS